MKKITIIRLLSYGIAAFVIVSGIAVSGWVRAAKYERAVVVSYQRALSGLAGSVNKLDTSLSKCVYSNTTAGLAVMAADIWMESSTASQCLSELPVSMSGLEKTSKFISQIGDYAYTLIKKVAAGETLTNSERTNIITLADDAASLNSELTELYASSFNSAFISSYSADVSTDSSKSALLTTLSTIEQSFPDTPVLIYDGPFSDHITKKVPACVSANKTITSAADCKKKLAAVLNVSEAKIKYTGELKGTIPLWSFTVGSGNDTVTVDMAQNGGGIISILCARQVSAVSLKESQAVARAGAFINACGIKSMTMTYWYISSGVLYVNYEYNQDGVIIYPDLIQVGVALDTGEVCHYEATGYYSNHIAKRDVSAVITEKQAHAVLASGLTVQNSRLTIIPTAGKSEQLCYEFHCIGKNKREYLFYIDAKTGAEVQILMLVISDNGTLTM